MDRLMAVFTTLLSSCSRSSVLFCEVFSISIALSLSAVLRLSNITPGGSEAKVVGRNTKQKRDNKKNYKNRIIAFKDFLLVKIGK